MILIERFKWTNNSPSIYISLYYELKRTDKDMYYRLQYVIEPVRGASYFGYSIITSITLDEYTVLNDYFIKNANPYQWSNNIVYTTDWFKVPNKTSGTTYTRIRIRGGERNQLYSYNLPIISYASSVGRIKINGSYVEMKPYVKVNGSWRETQKTFVKANGVWNETR